LLYRWIIGYKNPSLHSLKTYPALGSSRELIFKTGDGDDVGDWILSKSKTKIINNK